MFKCMILGVVAVLMSQGVAFAQCQVQVPLSCEVITGLPPESVAGCEALGTKIVEIIFNLPGGPVTEEFTVCKQNSTSYALDATVKVLQGVVGGGMMIWQNGDLVLCSESATCKMFDFGPIFGGELCITDDTNDLGSFYDSEPYDGPEQIYCLFGLGGW